VSPTYQNYRQPPTGTASANCRQGTRTKMSSIYRDRTVRLEQTPVHKSVHEPQAKALSLFEKGPLALVAGEEFEPSTPGL